MSIMSFVGLAAAFYLLKLLFQSLSWWAIAGLVLLFVSWIGMMLARIVANQEGLLYQPHPQVPGSVMGKTPADNPPFFRSPHEHGLAYEDVSLTTADGERLHAWFLPVAPHAYPQDPTSPLHNTPGVAPSVAVAAAAAAIASASSNASSSDTAAAGSAGGAAAKAPASPYSRHVPTVLYLHENAGNMGMRLFNLRLLLTRLHCNVLILSYRGYGASSGAPSERGLVADADAALRHLALRPDIDPARIFLFGRSLGGAVAIAAAARHPELVRGVVVENSFASINLLVDSIFPILAPVKERVLRLRWFSDRRAPAIRAPVCFVAAQQDEVVPAAHADRLLEAATGAPARVRKASQRHIALPARSVHLYESFYLLYRMSLTCNSFFLLRFSILTLCLLSLGRRCTCRLRRAGTRTCGSLADPSTSTRSATSSTPSARPLSPPRRFPPLAMRTAASPATAAGAASGGSRRCRRLSSPSRTRSTLPWLPRPRAPTRRP